MRKYKVAVVVSFTTICLAYEVEAEGEKEAHEKAVRQAYEQNTAEALTQLVEQGDLQIDDVQVWYSTNPTNV